MSLSEDLIKVKAASAELSFLSEQKINSVLCALAAALIKETPALLRANQKDLVALERGPAIADRLALSPEKIKNIAAQMRAVARLPSPLHQVLEKRTRPNGLQLTKITVPLGVVGVIYEARPNVTADVFALCFKSGNACVLKGGREAEHSNTALIKIIHRVLRAAHLNPAVAHLITGGRRETQVMLQVRGLIDVIIPRGGASLIRYVREQATVPVIETGAGVVHTFVDATAQTAMCARIVDNAKTSRPAACNALDTLLIHQKKLKDLPVIVAPLAQKRVKLFADQKSFAVLKKYYPQSLLHPATPEHFGREFLSLELAIKTVANLNQALSHIARYGSKHSEALISSDQKNIKRFLSAVDAAVLYINAATTFTDGGEFGLGAEIGISTQKLHARGPMGLTHLMSYKWLVHGRGQVRS